MRTREPKLHFSARCGRYSVGGRTDWAATLGARIEEVSCHSIQDCLDLRVAVEDLLDQMRAELRRQKPHRAVVGESYGTTDGFSWFVLCDACSDKPLKVYRRQTTASRFADRHNDAFGEGQHALPQPSTSDISAGEDDPGGGVGLDAQSPRATDDSTIRVGRTRTDATATAGGEEVSHPQEPPVLSPGGSS